MKKKIDPKEQTTELNRAKLDFIIRNEKEFQKLKELLEKNERVRDELTTRLASIGGTFNPAMKKRWDSLYEYSEVPCDRELAEYLKKVEIPKAVNSVWRWLDYTMGISYQEMVMEPREPVTYDNKRYEYLKTKVFDMYCRDAREIFAELTNGRPAVHLLLGIDLTRQKEVIIEEVKKLVTEYQKKLGVKEMSDKRFKWLPIRKRLLQVWDLRRKRKSFSEIAQDLKTSPDAAKKSFYRMFEIMTGQKYNPILFKRDYWEIRKAEIEKECSTCPDHPKNGGECNTLCPDMLVYVDQDHAYERKQAEGYQIDNLKEENDPETLLIRAEEENKKT